MRTYKANIPDLTNGLIQSVGGRVLFIQSVDSGATLAVTLIDSFGNQYVAQSLGAGAKLAPAPGFASVQIIPSVPCNVQFIVTDGDIDIQLTQTSVSVTNTGANPVPVSLVSEPGAPVQVYAPAAAPVNVAVQGTVNVSGATLTATNVGINNTSANPIPVSLISEPGAPVPVSISGQPVSITPTQAATIAENAPAAVAAFNSSSPNQVQIVAAGARRAVRVRNAGTALLYVGGSAVTPTNAVIVLNPGDVWAETDVPSAALYATSDAGSTANVQVIA